MSSRFRRSAALLLAFVALPFARNLRAQTGQRISGSPNDGSVVLVPGSTHPLTRMAGEIGRAPASLPMKRVLLQVASSPEQEAALQQLLADQQDPGSPRYHAWLTPEQFGEQFGAAQQDIDAIANWLRSQGFQVTETAAGRRSIEFGGTVQQVETAFHTQMERYVFDGREHIANATDISIPAAFAAVVRGVVALHDFGVRPFHHLLASPAPQTDLSGGLHGLSPYDFAAIYDLLPLWAAGFDGTGESIAVVGETDIKLSDIASFRSLFGLPANAPTVIVNGTDPGVVSGDETESDLDVEWAGAVAKGATIKFVTSASTAASDGVTLSAQYIVQHATAPVMSLSYGLCEALLGSSNSFYASLWEQAAAEGIGVFVANGDSGSAGCDASGNAFASLGMAVNGLASTPYNVAVGGTEFNDGGSSTYWSASNNAQLASATGYIPEVVWNESRAIAGGSGLYAGGGGASTLWSRPSWQAGPGITTGAARLTPDVSLAAAGHDGYLIEQEGSLYLVGGTSAATPPFAALMAIVNQYTHTANGNPNSKLYALAASAPSVFHDITSGSNAVECLGGSPECSAPAPSTNVGTLNGYSAAAGYDMATGLGSVDANALVTNWNVATAAPGIVSLSPNPMTGSASIQSLTINGAGFVAGSGLTVTVGAVTYQGSSVNFISSSQLVVIADVGTSAQSLPVQVMLPGGKTTNSVTLNVIAPSIAPEIASLSPNPMSASTAAQTLTIAGSGFVAGSGLKVTVGNTVYQGSQILSVSNTQLTVSVVVGASAQSVPVTVTDPNGLTSGVATLAVAGAAPVVASLSPNPISASTTAQTLTIAGSGFAAGSGLKVTVGNTVYQGSQILSVSSTQLTVSVIVGASAQSVPVTVTDPNGLTSGAATLTVAGAAPVVASLSPNPMSASTTAQTLTIAGSGFGAGSGLKVTVGNSVYQGSQILSVSSTQLTVSVIVGASAQSVPVTVTGPNGLTSGAATLTVAGAAPVVASLSPNPMSASTPAQTLTIAGSGFGAGSGLKVTVGNSVYQGSQILSVSSTQLTVSVIVGASAQSVPVTVTDPNGLTSGAAMLAVGATALLPVISNVSPNPMTGSASPQTLTIAGSGFVAGSGLKVTVGGAVYQGSQITSVSGTQLTVSVVVGTSAQNLPVKVTDPSGLTSSFVMLTVTLPDVLPAIASLSPNPMTGSNSAQILTLTGSGFAPGLRLTIGGTSIASSELAVLTATQLQVSIVTGLSAHTYAVQVLNPSGEVSDIVNLQVTTPSAPAVGSLAPNPLVRASALRTMTVVGENLRPGLGGSSGGQHVALGHPGEILEARGAVRRTLSADRCSSRVYSPPFSSATPFGAPRGSGFTVTGWV